MRPGETGALIELSTSDPAVETVLRQLVPAAKAEAVVYLSAHPGDLQGALDAYYRRISANRSRLGGSAKVLSALSQLKDWKEATEGLCASISSWRSWSAETGRLELEHGELKMREREFREKLAAIQARCPELSPIEVQPPASPPPAACPESLPEGDVPCTLGGGERSAAGRSAAGRAGSVTRASFAPPASDGAGPAPDALVRLGALLASAQDRADFEIVPRLAPFMIGAAHDLPLELQRGLLADAVPHLETLRSEVGQAVELGREIERALEQERRSEPPSAAPRAQASLTTSRSMRGSRCGA